MDHRFDDKYGGSEERKSRKNPRLKEEGTAGSQQGSGDGGLNVMGDSRVHPIERRMAGTSSADGERRQSRSGAADGRTPGASGRGQSVAGRSSAKSTPRASLQTAATSERGGKTASAEKNGLAALRQERLAVKKKRRRRIIAMIVAECIALVFIFGYAYMQRNYNTIQRPQFEAQNIKNNDLSVETEEKMKGYWTIAVFGVDARDKAIEKYTNADVNIICNINQDTGEIKLVSVFRDTYLNVSKSGSYNKINQAYFTGGAEQAVAALNRNLDLNITDFATFNWKAVAQGIDLLGGVDIELSKAEFYYINSFITETSKATGIPALHLKSAGMNHLSGVQAVAYGRLRLMDTDYARTERQRKVIKQAFEKAKQADFATLNNVIVTVFPNVATSIDLMDMVRCAKNISKYYLSDTTGFPQARGALSMGKKGDCVIPQTLETNVVKLHQFLFGDEEYNPSATVKNISAQIAADSGMYREGTYVDHVSTEGGVIQKPKAPVASTEEARETTAAEEDDKKYATIYVLDEDGNKVEKKVAMEKNADGEYIEPETNADGIAKKWSLNEDGDLVKQETDADGNVLETIRPTAPETDENGDPIEPTEGEIRPTRPRETDEDGNPIEPTEGEIRPTRPRETDEDGNPIEPTEGEVRPTRPRETDENGNPIEGEVRPTAAGRPGNPDETSASTRPTAPHDPGRPTTSETPGGADRPTGGAGTSTRPTAPEESESSDRPTAAGVVDRPGAAVEPTEGGGPSGSAGPAGSGTTSITPSAAGNAGGMVVDRPGA